MNGFQIRSKRLKVQHKRVHHNRSLAGGGGVASGEVTRGGGVRGTGSTYTPPHPPPVDNIWTAAGGNGGEGVVGTAASNDATAVVADGGEGG